MPEMSNISTSGFCSRTDGSSNGYFPGKARLLSRSDREWGPDRSCRRREQKVGMFVENADLEMIVPLFLFQIVYSRDPRLAARTPVGIRAADGGVVEGHLVLRIPLIDIRFHHVGIRFRIRRILHKLAGIRADGDRVPVEEHFNRLVILQLCMVLGNFAVSTLGIVHSRVSLWV